MGDHDETLLIMLTTYSMSYTCTAVISIVSRSHTHAGINTFIFFLTLIFHFISFFMQWSHLVSTYNSNKSASTFYTGAKIPML